MQRSRASRSFGVLVGLVAVAVPVVSGGAGHQGPRVLGRLPDSSQIRLERAFALARARLESRPACRRLYRELARSGLESLEATRYLAPTLRERQRLCERRVSAFTVPGGLTTRLCPSFGRLSTHRAAAVLLHEGLHTAGLLESPAFPDAMSSSEIDDLVSRRCGL